MVRTVETVSAADAEIEALPVGLCARPMRLPETMEGVGLEALRAPHARHLDGWLGEFRIRAEEGIAREFNSRRPDGGWWCFTFSSGNRKRRRAVRSRPPGNELGR